LSADAHRASSDAAPTRDGAASEEDLMGRALLRGCVPLLTATAIWAPQTSFVSGRNAVEAPVVATEQAQTEAGRATDSAAYPWPLRPFHRVHPVRAAFGDPRTSFLHARNGDALAGAGVFSFHDGIDIDAPTGSRVYSVESGVVRSVKPEYSVWVQAADGRAFVYTHIVTYVRTGQTVIAGVTVLGRVKIWNGHLHFSEVSASGRVTNPLLPGHLTPYRDTTRPIIAGLEIRSGDRSIPPFELQGRVAIVADAYDLPMPVARARLPVTRFARDRFGVTPTAVSWSLSTLRGRTIVPRTTVVNYRNALPDNGSFWRVYARGTYQNRAPIVTRYHQEMPGTYLFWLTQSLDTSRLRDGVYVVAVSAVDVHGNTGSLEGRIEIRNHDRLPVERRREARRS
jgi:hypothetical protein